MKLFILMNKQNKKKGFTLIELLIVIIILAILAAVVIPQFSSSTDDARRAALRASLSEMRSAIEMYYHQHLGNYPAAMETSSGAGDQGTWQAFREQLIKYTDENGNVSNVKSAVFKYGPYLKQQNLPKNPMKEEIPEVTVTIVNSGADWGDLSQPVAEAGTTSWWFDTKSGKFVANETGYLDW